MFKHIVFVTYHFNPLLFYFLFCFFTSQCCSVSFASQAQEAVSESAAWGGAAGRDKHQAKATRVSQTSENGFGRMVLLCVGISFFPSIKAAPIQPRANVVSLHTEKKFNPLLQEQHVTETKSKVDCVKISWQVASWYLCAQAALATAAPPGQTMQLVTCTTLVLLQSPSLRI